MFCWTTLQLSFLRDENLMNVVFTSPPSCGKTVLKKAKVKYFGQEKGEDVVFLVPCYEGKQTLLFHHLKKEFGSLNSECIKVDNVKADVYFDIDEDDLMDKINNEYKDHHVFIDEVGILKDKDIFLLKKVAEQLAHQSISFWVSVTYFAKKNLQISSNQNCKDNSPSSRMSSMCL